jgi:hypothetical protein
MAVEGVTAAMTDMLLPLSCSSPCVLNMSTFHSRVLTVVSSASRGARGSRNTTLRLAQHRRSCAKLKLGCTFLEKGRRRLLPNAVLPALGYTGASAVRDC